MVGVELDIREATGSDAEQVLNFLEAVECETDFLAWDKASNDWTIEDIASFLDWANLEDNQLCLVACLGCEIVGLLTIRGQETPFFAHIGDMFIAVKKAYWKQGIAGVLMDIAVSFADEEEIWKRLELTVQERNVAAVALYKKFGFEIEGIKKWGVRSKAGQLLDLYAMSRVIG